MSTGLRIGLVGATGLLGRDLLDVLDVERLPVAELRLFAGERSLGEDIEFRGESVPVEVWTEAPTGLDVVLLCTPSGVALDLVRDALRAEVACIDCSGALVGSVEVPLAVASLGAHDDLASAPLISAPPGPALVWAPVLAAIQREAGLRRVVGTVMHSASSGGRTGIDALSEQTLALLNQHPDPTGGDDGAVPRAFDCHPHPADDAADKEGASAVEAQIVAVLRRLLGPDVAIAATSVHVPTFAGQGATLSIETEQPITPDRAARVLAATSGLDVRRDRLAPGTREAVGGDDVIVARLRADATAAPGHGLLLWLAADPVRLGAANAVRLVRARFPSL